MDILLLPLFGCVAGVAAFGWGFFVWRRVRLIVDTPTAKVRSMPMGRVELHGRAQKASALVSPITKSPCAYYRYRVDEQQGRGKKKRWVTVKSGDSSSRGFYLEDDTGLVLVEPRGATIEIGSNFHESVGGLAGTLFGDDASLGHWSEGASVGFSRRRRFTEWRIDEGAVIYLLGVCQENSDTAERQDRAAAKLGIVMADPQAQTYLDRDGDGTVSEEEWESARRIIEQETVDETIDERVVVGADRTGVAPFFITDQGEASIVTQQQWKAFAGVFGGAVLAIGSLWVLVDQLGARPMQGG